VVFLSWTVKDAPVLKRLALPLLTVVLASCATTSAQLVNEAAACESFASFDAKVREQLEALLGEAPGETLVRESSRLNTARRACARHVLSGLLALREEQGVEAVQQELNALSATYRQDDLRALMTAALGEEVVTLEPLLAEARVKVTRRDGAANAERRDEAEREKLKPEVPGDFGAPPNVPDSLCDESKPCEQLRCVLEHAPASPDAAARACLDEVSTAEPMTRARRAAEVLGLLPSSPSPARTEARVMLDTLRTQLWPQVDAAIAAKQLGRAAQLASVFLPLPSVNARVEQLRDQAQAHHLARAKSASPEASWLHRKLAEEFGGPAADALGGQGRWEKPRSRCKAPVPELPELPAGLGGTLSLRCDVQQPEGKKPSGELRTFELESSLRGQRLEASLHFTCADRAIDSVLTIEDPGIEGFPEQALRNALEGAIGSALTQCARVHELAATRSCTELRKRLAAELIVRFVEHARFLHRWEPCFEEWLVAHEGVLPPRPP
jgi:hypothetical protein